MAETETLTIAEGYRAMFAFLEAYWERGMKSSGDLAGLLGSMDYSKNDDPPRLLDIAQWYDWLNAVEAIKS